MKHSTIKRRLENLEKEVIPTMKPTIVLTQSLDNPDLYFVSGAPGSILPEIRATDYQTYANGKPGELFLKQELLDRLEKDYLVIVVSYTKQWREGNE